MATTKVNSEFIAVNAISGTIIADGAITSTHLAANCVDSSELVTGSIDTIHIAANQVTATKIVTNGVLTRHISDDQVTGDKIASATIVSGNIANNAILTQHIDDNQINIDQLNVSDGSSGQALTTNGSGILSFSTISGGVDGISTSADATAITIDSSERIGMPAIGQTHPVGGQAKLGINSTDAAGASLSIHRHYDGGFGGYLVFQKSRNTDITNLGVVSNNDFLGSIEFTGADGNSYAQGAHIRGEVDGTPGDADMPTRLTFSTSADGSGTPTERMRITSAGNVGIGTIADHKFHVDVGAPNSSDKTLAAFSSQRTLRDIGFVWDDSTSTLGVATLTDHALTFHTNGNSAERMRLTSDGVAMGDTDGDYTHRGATGGLHVKRGGILMNGPPGDANMSSGTNGNQWTYLGQGGRGGSFTSLTISVPNPNNGASGVGYGGFSLEFYIAGYNAKYHSGHFAGYVNAGITLSKRAFWDSSGSGTLSSGSVGSQGFYLTIGFPSMTHPTCKFVINKGGHGGSAGNAAWTDMNGVSVTWA